MTEGLECVNHGGSSLTVSLEYVWVLGVWQATAALHGNTGAKLDFVTRASSERGTAQYT